MAHRGWRLSDSNSQAAFNCSPLGEALSSDVDKLRKSLSTTLMFTHGDTVPGTIAPQAVPMICVDGVSIHE